jgi:hypothetical protein
VATGLLKDRSKYDHAQEYEDQEEMPPRLATPVVV